jgi:beta-galactosidase
VRGAAARAAALTIAAAVAGCGGGASPGASGKGGGGGASGTAGVAGRGGASGAGAASGAGGVVGTGGGGASGAAGGGAGTGGGNAGGGGASGTGGSVGAGGRGGTGGVATGGMGGGAAGASGGGAGSGGNGGGYVSPGGARTDTVIDTGWKHLRSDATGASATAFNDASWSTVNVPHTWNATDGQDGGNNYYRGIGWYRRHYTPPASAAGKRIFLQFDGANIVANVYLNGTMVGTHRGGFARFRFDVTGMMTPGSDNVIAVQVSNAAAADVPPTDADFTFFGGLYRDVHVLVTDTVHVDALDFASAGVYVSATSVSAANAMLTTRVRVRNDQTAAAMATVDTVVVRPDGSTAARLSASASVAAGATTAMSATAAFPNPHLWNGVADPYVYTVYAEVRVGGTVTDVVSVPFGFRSFAVDAAQGFSLNGQYLDLHASECRPLEQSLRVAAHPA